MLVTSIPGKHPNLFATFDTQELKLDQHRQPNMDPTQFNGKTSGTVTHVVGHCG